MVVAENLQHPELRRVRVLELVDQDVVEALLPALRHLGVALQPGHRPVDEVGEGSRLLLRQRRLEPGVGLGQVGQAGVAVRGGVGGDVGGGEPVVLGLGAEGERLLGQPGRQRPPVPVPGAGGGVIVAFGEATGPVE